MERALAASADEQALQSAIASRDEQVIRRLVVAGASTTIRQAAARAVEDPEMLRQLIRETRGGKDNNVYRILTSKRDLKFDQLRKLEQLRVEIDAASTAIERHVQRPYDISYGPLLDQFETRWEAVSEQADSELRSRIQKKIDDAREAIAEHRRRATAQVLQEQAAADAAAEASRQREQQAQADTEAMAEQARLLEQQNQALTEEQSREEQTVREIMELIRKARGALRDGGTARGAGLRRTIEEKQLGLPSLPANVLGQLQQLDQQLDELKDWKSFSVMPKRAELIEEMELLANVSLEPLVLAQRIKDLQDEWRTLSKGAGESLESDWQRFQLATEKAHQPCRDYFAAQALVRQQNLQRREALLAKLTTFNAEQHWERPDWTAVIRALNNTRRAWRDCSAVDRDAGRTQQEAFTALMTSLQGRLDAEYARNQAQKQSLIDHSQQLLSGDGSRKSIDAIKELQKQWQTVGPVPREIDQRLWQRFRQHCDAVFQKREQSLAAQAAGLEANKTQAIALCEELEHIAALEGAELRQRVAAFGDPRKRFEALGELPRADTRELHKRFDQAIARSKEAIARQCAREIEQSWNDLFDAANHVRAYKLAVVEGLEPEQLVALRQKAEMRIASVTRWPIGGFDAIWQALVGERAEDLTANEAALRLLCVRAELSADLPTPPEDQPLRREYQLQRLLEGMGQRVKTDEMQLDTLAIAWVRVGAVDNVVYLPLQQRFLRCRNR